MPETIRTLLGFDFGEKSIGVAYGQRITESASALPALKAQNGQPDWQQVEKLLKTWQPDRLVVGFPLNMDGTEQLLSQRAKKFANRLFGRFAIPVDLVDERLTTAEAKSDLFAEGGYRALQKGAIDSQSAVIIVQSWFQQNPTS
ncbi:Holliday junction resolvase RuvX [Pleionea litopenaei]|uniref:Putative pre-16S rRNA nuclease n=1 Tax=Pleionea litopenaei TaxID=3070815 RepID=A0AA51RQX9_9GAMM|nr:Holliday junction resolvase RuvX [Pleionea sp. HL-JVS1]WMS85889.1 Holliday junction resolvase RuvX [Pleionea sp. HL-JVS1]